MKRIILYIILILCCLFLYGRYIEINNIEIKEYTIKEDKLSDSIKELKIIQFSDILYSNTKDKKYYEKLIDKINNENGDIILFTGDLFNNKDNYSEDDYTYLKDMLSNIKGNLYKAAVIGDNDYKYIDNYKDILYESGFELLDNNNKLLFYKDDNPINIIGLSDTSKIDMLDNEYIYNIVITHSSDIFDSIYDSNIDLVLSGNSLGGIVKIPFYGGIIKLDGSIKYVDEYYERNNTKMYVSNGIGYYMYEFRLFNTPSISTYRFS